MPAKDPSAGLEARAAVVGVTEGVVGKLLLVSLVVTLLLAGCAVDVSSSTPNSFDCDPGPNDLSTFMSQVVESSTGYEAAGGSGGNTCISCHGTASTDNNARSSVFHIQDQNITTTAVEIENFCIAYMLGQRDPSQRLINHPQDYKHDGGQFTAAEISGLITWVQTATITGN
jgi:hypothetical protein